MMYSHVQGAAPLNTCHFAFAYPAQAKQETYTTKTQPPAHALAAPDWALNNEPGHLVRVGHHTVLDLCVGVFECSVPCQPCCLTTHHSTLTVRLPAGQQIRRIKPYVETLRYFGKSSTCSRLFLGKKRKEKKFFF